LQNSVGQSLLLAWLIPHAENFLCNKVPWTHGREKIAKINVMPETSVIVAHVEDNLFTQQNFPIFFLLLSEIDFTIQKMPTLSHDIIPHLVGFLGIYCFRENCRLKPILASSIVRLHPNL
jgi:hypothetical protein